MVEVAGFRFSSYIPSIERFPMSVGLLESRMAKKKSESGGKKLGRPPSKEGTRAQAVVVRGRVGWKTWVDELADHCRMDISDLVDQALVEFARGKGFDKLPPKR